MDKNLFQIAESMTNLVDYHVDDETGEILIMKQTLLRHMNQLNLIYILN